MSSDTTTTRLLASVLQAQPTYCVIITTPIYWRGQWLRDHVYNMLMILYYFSSTVEGRNFWPHPTTVLRCGYQDDRRFRCVRQTDWHTGKPKVFTTAYCKIKSLILYSDIFYLTWILGRMHSFYTYIHVFSSHDHEIMITLELPGQTEKPGTENSNCGYCWLFTLVQLT